MGILMLLKSQKTIEEISSPIDHKSGILFMKIIEMQQAGLYGKMMILLVTITNTTLNRTKIITDNNTNNSNISRINITMGDSSIKTISNGYIIFFYFLL